MVMESAVSMAVRRGILYTSLATMALAAPALASAEEGAAEVERIVVTGSRIKRVDMETASPIEVINAADIAAGSFTSLEQVLQQSTVSSGVGENAASNISGSGTATVNLRGMGSYRTLVLLNGRRMVLSGVGADASVDLNTIPIAMVERIEVLKDGGSAIYGSDAIAGVVNIITKKELDGAELDISYGGSDEGDGNTFDASLVTGLNWEQGSGVFGVSYIDRGKVKQTDRDFSDCILMGPDEAKECYYSYYTPHGFMDYGNGENTYLDGVEQDGFEEFDLSPDQYLYTPLKVLSLNTALRHEISADTEVFFEGLYTRRESKQQLAADPIYLDVYLDDPAFEGSEMCQDGCPWDNYVDEDGLPAEWGSYYRRMTESGARLAEQDTDTVRFAAGALGFLNIGNGYDWELSYTYGRNEATEDSHNTTNLTQLEQAFYADPDEWFSGRDVSDETLAQVMYTDTAEGGNQMHLVNANLGGDIYELPAGVVAMATGVEYRHEKGWHYPDEVTRAGEGSMTQQDNTSGDYSIVEVYGELSIPLIADKAFAQQVTLDLAGRWFDYSTFGSDNTYKLGLSWRVNDDLMLRAVKSTSFRAPNVSELYAGDSGSYDYLYDPCSGVTDPTSRCFDDENFESGYEQWSEEVENTWVTSEDLNPEESDNLTVGIVYNPNWVDGLSMTVDYWSFEVSDAISYIDTQAFLDDCYAGDESACQQLKIERNEFGDISYIESTSLNIGMFETSGIDTNVEYRFDAAGLEWAMAIDAAYMIESIEDGEEYAGYVGGSFGAYPEWQTNYSLDISGDNWALHYRLYYIGEMTNEWTDYYGEYRDLEEEKSYRDDIDGVLYHDISATYYLNDQNTIVVGIDNVLDEEPPYIVDAWEANTSSDIYDVMGRYLFASYNLRF